MAYGLIMLSKLNLIKIFLISKFLKINFTVSAVKERVMLMCSLMQCLALLMVLLLQESESGSLQ